VNDDKAAHPTGDLAIKQSRSLVDWISSGISSATRAGDVRGAPPRARLDNDCLPRLSPFREAQFANAKRSFDSCKELLEYKKDKKLCK
jgi:hypothetical protein